MRMEEAGQVRLPRSHVPRCLVSQDSHLSAHVTLKLWEN
jgi:hypothetical protein